MLLLRKCVVGPAKGSRVVFRLATRLFVVFTAFSAEEDELLLDEVVSMRVYMFVYVRTDRCT